MEINLIYKIFIAAIPLLYAITLHEVAHGWAARRYGDNTAYAQGRLSLNPIKHIDLVGTIIVPLVTFILAGFAFGWAKPVPVNTSNLRKPKEHGRLVSLAGPAANLVMSIMWFILLIAVMNFKVVSDFALLQGLKDMAVFGISLNLFFMAFNLIPILPLDGGRVLESYLPPKQQMAFAQTENYGMFIVMGLAMLGVLKYFTSPIVGTIQGLMLGVLPYTIVLGS